MMILKGQSAEIKVPAKAQFTGTDFDEFTVVVRRGNDKDYDELLQLMRGDNPLSDRELLDKYIIRLEDLTDDSDNPVNGDGVLKWEKEQPQAKAEPMTDEQSDRLQVIGAMTGMIAYRSELVKAVYTGVGNASLYQAGRLGNLRR